VQNVVGPTLVAMATTFWARRGLPACFDFRLWIAAQSYSTTAATAVHQSSIDAPATIDGATETVQSPTAMCRWTSKRIRAAEGSDYVLARYSQKSSSASHDDEPTGAQTLLG